MPLLHGRCAVRISFRQLSILRDRTFGLAFSRGYKIVLNRSYDDAINLLNTLQTPYKALKERWDAGIKPNENDNLEMRKCLKQIGYTQDDLTKLNIVHVAGTKGKGSTCAYVDSILSQYSTKHGIPRKTGLYTSPHLIAVRERIRINSKAISAPLFAKYFFEVWDAFEPQGVDSVRRPFYFRYLTLMSYHAFIAENVNVAIYEVGMGGEYDATNLVERPAVTGISTLGIDHTFTLGDTIDKIAWNKAGIQKKGVPSFTVTQVPEAMKVIEDRAVERDVEKLTVVHLDPRLDVVKITPDAPFQRGNASLAISLTETVLSKVDPSFERADPLSKGFVEGLESVVWRGRCETKVDGNITWYLDGAHTADSIIIASKWFGDSCLNKLGTKILIFNQQGHREAQELLDGLHAAIKSQPHIHFDHVIFCPTVPSESSSSKDSINLSTDTTALAGLIIQKVFAARWKELDFSQKRETKIVVLPSVEHALGYVRDIGSGVDGDGDGEKEKKREVHAFVTGSVHLVGRALGSLEGVDAL